VKQISATCSCLKFGTELDRKHSDTLTIRGFILSKNPTNVLMCVRHHFIHTVTLLHASALKGPTSGDTDTSCDEQSQQNT